MPADNKSVKSITAKNWLIQNNYPEVVKIIDDYVAYNKARGSGEKRNFWDLLAGRKNGDPVNRNGFVFPILESIRTARKPNFPNAKSAIKKNKREIVPPPIEQARWTRKKN